MVAEATFDLHLHHDSGVDVGLLCTTTAADDEPASHQVVDDLIATIGRIGARDLEARLCGSPATT